MKQGYKEIDDYLSRFKSCSPESLLKYMGQLRDFFYANMTKDGRKFFEQSKLEEEINGYRNLKEK